MSSDNSIEVKLNRYACTFKDRNQKQCKDVVKYCTGLLENSGDVFVSLDDSLKVDFIRDLGMLYYSLVAWNMSQKSNNYYKNIFNGVHNVYEHSVPIADDFYIPNQDYDGGIEAGLY